MDTHIEHKDYTEEEVSKMYKERFEALDKGDEKLAALIFEQIPLEPKTLLHAKKVFGVDYIKQRNLNTIRAEQKYGKDWLNS